MTVKILKIDYDKRYIKETFKYRINAIYRVYFTKREYLPDIMVTSAKRTRKGWHLTISFEDKETRTLDGSDVLLIQACLLSDPTRTLFDYLRLQRGEKCYNLLFDYKNGRTAKEVFSMESRLNDIITEIKAKYEKRKTYKLWKMCAMCGKYGDVEIKYDGDKVVGNWHYYGKINLNSLYKDKYHYKVIFDKNNKILPDKNGHMRFKKILNTHYDPKVKPKMVEYWEHIKCPLHVK